MPQVNNAQILQVGLASALCLLMERHHMFDRLSCSFDVAGIAGCKEGTTVTFDPSLPTTRRHSSPASSARRRNSVAALAPVNDNQYTVCSSADIKTCRDLKENSYPSWYVRLISQRLLFSKNRHAIVH